METVVEQPDSFIFPNPENPLEIKLPVFEGPLELLLHLIRKKELDIYQVALSELTGSYLAYLDYLDSVNLEYAGEFLETAATLIWIKSKHLLPKPPVEEVLEDDPEAQLRRQLIEYERYKQAAFLLSCVDQLGRDVFVRPELEDLEEKKEEPPQAFEEVSLYGLMEAFHRVMQRPQKTLHVVQTESYRLEDCVAEIIQKFYAKPHYKFEDFFLSEPAPRAHLIVRFMAILEMTKWGLVRLEQKASCDSIDCYAHEEFQQNATKWQQQHPPMEALKTA